MSYINYNGKIYPDTLPVFLPNRGQNYGDGFFESIRIHEGEILFFDDHMDRMFRAMKALKMEVPELFSPFFFHKQIIDLAHEEKINGNARVRIGIFRGGKGLYEPILNTPEYYIEVIPMENGFEWEEELCEMGVFTDVPKNFSSISFFKSLNAGCYVMAAIHKKENHLQDCLLLNSFGKIADAISSNIFWIENKDVFTIPVSEGGVDGVMRKNLIRILYNNKIPVEEKSITPRELKSADEVFLTNVGWGIKQVTKFEDKNFSTNKTKEIFQLLISGLRKVDD